MTGTAAPSGTGRGLARPSELREVPPLRLTEDEGPPV